MSLEWIPLPGLLRTSWLFTTYLSLSLSKADLQQDRFRSRDRLRNEWLLVQLLWLLSNAPWKREESDDDGGADDNKDENRFQVDLLSCSQNVVQMPG